MPIIDPDQGASLPSLADLANNQAAFSNFYANVLSRNNLRYTDEANRTALHPANTEGEESYLTASNRKEINDGAAWISLFTRSLYAYTRMTAEQTVNNSTAFVNATNLVVPLPAAGTFAFEATLFSSSSDVADIKYSFTWPAGATALWGTHGLATTAVVGTGDMLVDTEGASGATNPHGGGQFNLVKAYGEVTTGGTAGNLQLQFAQNTAELSNTTLKARSHLMVWRTA